MAKKKKVVIAETKSSAALKETETSVSGVMPDCYSALERILRDSSVMELGVMYVRDTGLAFKALFDVRDGENHFTVIHETWNSEGQEFSKNMKVPFVEDVGSEAAFAVFDSIKVQL